MPIDIGAVFGRHSAADRNIMFRRSAFRTIALFQRAGSPISGPRVAAITPLCEVLYSVRGRVMKVTILMLNCAVLVLSMTATAVEAGDVGSKPPCHTDICAVLGSDLQPGKPSGGLTEKDFAIPAQEGRFIYDSSQLRLPKTN